jgi:hypothetical protein
MNFLMGLRDSTKHTVRWTDVQSTSEFLSAESIVECLSTGQYSDDDPMIHVAERKNLNPVNP